MPFCKDDENINRLERTPEKFTKEFVDYVCHLYASNVPTSKMSEILNIPENTVKKYLNKQVVWFNDLNSNDMQEVRTNRSKLAKSLHTAQHDFNKNQKSNEVKFIEQNKNRYYVYLHKTLDGVGGVAGYINSSGKFKRYKVCYKSVEYMVHRVVYQMFNGDICSGKVINHIDTNPLNNTISNLEMVTTAENNRKTRKEVLGELSSTNTSGIQNVRRTYQDNGGWSAQVFYKDVCGVTKGKKFYFSTYGEETAMKLAEDYVVEMKQLVAEERVRLENIMENENAFC